MTGATSPLPLHALMAWTGRTLREYLHVFLSLTGFLYDDLPSYENLYRKDNLTLQRQQPAFEDKLRTNTD
jgi:hypothetical protein